MEEGRCPDWQGTEQVQAVEAAEEEQKDKGKDGGDNGKDNGSGDGSGDGGGGVGDGAAEELSVSGGPVEQGTWLQRLCLSACGAWLGLRRRLIKSSDEVLWHTYDARAVPDDGQLPVVLEAKDPSELNITLLLYFYFVSHSELVCVMAFLAALFANFNLLATTVPVLILVHVLLQSPRADGVFWTFAFAHCSAVIMIKFLFQLDIFCVTADIQYSLAPSPECQTGSQVLYTEMYQPHYLVGIHKLMGGSFASYLGWDLLCLLVVVWHRTNLLNKDLWRHNEDYFDGHLEEFKKREQNRAVGEESPQQMELASPVIVDSSNSAKQDKAPTHALAEQEHKQGSVGAGAYVDMDGSSLSSIGAHSDELTDKLEGITSNSASLAPYMPKWYDRAWARFAPAWLQGYYFAIIPSNGETIYEVKAGKDFYQGMFLSELVCVVYIILCHAPMASSIEQDLSSALGSNYFSGSMVITLFIQVLFIVGDRIAYVYRSLRVKVLLVYFAVPYWLSYILFIWPTISQSVFGNNIYLQMFFILKINYMVLSGLQIRYGYPAIENSGFSFITNKPSISRGYVFRVYRAVPFIFELKSLLDWVLQASALDVWENFKLLDIYTNLFLTQCDLIYWRSHKRGNAQPLHRKFSTGCLLFVVLLIIIFAPLLLFSSANPGTSLNNVESVKVKLDILGPSGEFTMLQIGSIAKQRTASGQEFQDLKQAKLVDENDQATTVQRIEMVAYSDDKWQISPPALSALMNSLADSRDQMFFRVYFSFTRPGPLGFQTITGQRTIPMNTTQQKQLSDVLNERTAHWNITIPNLLPSTMRLLPTSKPVVLTQRSVDKFHTAVLELHLNKQGFKWWTLAERTAIPVSPSFIEQAENTTLSSQKWLKNAPIVFTTISNPIWNNPLHMASASYSVIGIYLGVVWFVGQFTRLIFSGLVQMIQYTDLQYVDDLIMIVEGIYIARHNKNLAIEEELYRKLIKIFRTPDLLVKLTRRRD